jgi:OFA family oxalate/formate antiporter-like MFS transporter
VREPNAIQQPRRIFYGWVMVLTAMISGAFATGVGVWGVSVFVVPMETDLGWSRTAFFMALTIRSLLTGLTAPFVGPLFDTSWGPRAIMVSGAFAMGGSLVGLRFVTELWQFYLLFGVVGAVANIGLGPFFVQAVLPKWFIRRRGIALGVAATGAGFGSLLFPLTIQWLIDLAGWRDAWLVVGITALILVLPGALLVRTRPEDMGLLPDGAEAPPMKANGERRLVVAEDRSFTRSEAVRTRSFWLITLAFTLSGIGLMGFQSNWIPYFQGLGFTAAVGSLAITMYGVFTVGTRLIWGTMAGRSPVRYLLALELFLASVTIVLGMFIQNMGMLFAFTITHGIAIGGYFILQPLIVANYFGRQHLGAVNGTMRPFMTASHAISPFMVASLFDLTDSYRLSFIVVMFTWFFAAITIFWAKPPIVRKPSTEELTSGGNV